MAILEAWALLLYKEQPSCGTSVRGDRVDELWGHQETVINQLSNIATIDRLGAVSGPGRVWTAKSLHLPLEPYTQCVRRIKRREVRR